MDEGCDEHAVSAGFDADPFIGNCAIASADGIDDDDLGAARFELAEGCFDWV